jgi:hypothetical protein
MACGLIAHARHYVGVGVERYRHCGVAQELLDELGVGSFTEQQRGARVPEVVEADVGEIRLPQEGGERTLAHVGGVEGGSRVRAKDEILVGVIVAEHLYIRELRLQVLLKHVRCPRC